MYIKALTKNLSLVKGILSRNPDLFFYGHRDENLSFQEYARYETDSDNHPVRRGSLKKASLLGSHG